MISDTFLIRTKDAPPQCLLLEALPYVKMRGAALDMGPGAFRDTLFLLKEGFRVDAIDIADNVAALAPTADTFTFHKSSFEAFSFPKEKYALINAHNSLPFCQPNQFEAVWSGVVASLVPGGIFTGTFFGRKDDDK